MRPRNNQERIINSLNKTIYTLDHKYKGKEGFALLSPSQSFEGSADGFIALTDVTVISINGKITNLTQLTTGEKRLVPITELEISSGYILLINPKGIYNSTLLLDQYSGAAAAYSLRRLSSTYLGSAIRVRRSSDNTEQDIRFVGNKLDTNTLLSFVGAGDGFVSIIYDQNGTGHNFTQTTAARQGRIVIGGALQTLNGKPVILRSVDDNGGYLASTLDFSGDTTTYGFAYVGQRQGSQGCIFGSFDGGQDYGYFSTDGSVFAIVNNKVTPTNERLNGSSWIYSTRDDIYDDLVNQSLITAGMQFNYTATGYSLGYRFDNPSNFGMISFQEHIIFADNSNQLAVESNINNYYSIY